MPFQLLKMLKKYSAIIFFLIIIILSSFILLRGLETNYYQCDEFSYLRKSKYFEFYRKADFANPAWRDGQAIDQTKLMEYIYWLPSFIVSGKTFEDLAIQESPPGKNYADYGYWSSVYGKPFNLLKLSPKLKKTAILGRMISALFTIGYVSLAVFLIFLIFHSYFLSFLAFIFLLSHPIIIIHGRQILADSALNFFLLASFLFSLFFWKNFWQAKNKNFFIFAILGGISSGLAASTKLNGFIQSLFYTLIILITAFLLLFNKKERKNIKKIKELFLGLFIFLCLTFLIFYLLHPNIWKAPISGIKSFIDWRSYITKYYQDYFSGDSIKSIFEAFYLIFLRVAGYLIDVSSTGFIYKNEFGSQVLWPYLVINFLFFFLGIISFGQKIIKKKKYYKTLEFFSFIWSITVIVIVASYLRLDWTRYYWLCFLPFLIIDLAGFKLFLSKTASLIKKITNR